MEYWEFLLQKEGDQAWLPLESAQVEILEGRYRVMAHSGHLQSPVRVRISQIISEPPPPRRRVMKRTGTTNEAGLMVVMPFTWLKAGIWEINCSDGSPPDAPAAAWQYAIQLRVLPQETHEGDEWFPEDWSADSGALEDRISFAGAEAEIPPAGSDEGVSQTALMDAFGAIDQALAEAVMSGEESTAQGLGLSTSHRLELAQSAFMVNQGQVLMVVGQVKAAEAAARAPEALTLALRLLNPQSGTILTTLQHPLEAQSLPAAFAIPVTLPADLDTRLLLGELVLMVPTGDAVQVKALQRFTVTVDLASLFDAIANQAEDDADLDIVFPSDPAAAAEDAPKNIAGADLMLPLSPAADRPSPPPRSVPILLLPKTGLPLPPKIYYPSPHEATAHRPALPPLQAKKPPAAARSPESPADEPASPPVQRSSAIQLPGFVTPKKRPASPPAEADSAPPAATPEPPSPIDSEFRTLNLQDRFWSRLNSLAVEAQASALQQAQQAASQAPAAESISAPDSSLVDPWIDPPTAEPFAGEVVIYEDPEEPPPPVAPAPGPTTAAPDTEEILSPPMPLLEVPEGELRSGERVPITLRVPYYPNRLYLKVWITDPQTRTLADEPRQLTHLTPDGRGHLEGNLQLTVPQGCLEAWFEAIAVDMVTQQESYKASVSRVVIPPEVSSPSLDEFDL